MPTAFPKQEYEERLKKVRREMTSQGLDLLVVADPAHLNYLSGFDSWSYQNTQALLVPKQDVEPVWVGRGIDKGGACHTTWLSPDNIVAYEDSYSDSHSQHAMEAVAAEIKKRGWNSGTIGYEGDTYYFSPRAFYALTHGIPEAKWADVGLLINEIKTIKSPREIEFMRKAGRITDHVMQVAIDYIRPGIRENELAGRALCAQAEGVDGIGGAIPSAPPLILSGAHAGYPHTPFTNDVLERGSYTALELAGCYLRYNAALCRTVSLGKPSASLLRVGNIVQEGLGAAISVMKPGVTCHNVWAAWQAVLERKGYQKHSRIGYSLGLNYPPTWRDHTASLRKGEEIELQPGMCFHVICGMWAGDGTKEGDANYELSETVLITSKGTETLTSLERKLFVKD
ncbi:Xaa-Pro peptidase family protein [Bradyrhizobium sp. ISRA442]|uniref:M24 family metallopeptidase n=1 Tax=Bradyrhizobium sp. ISRA442 TaxID=2866197 RepID=UPI00311AF4F9